MSKLSEIKKSLPSACQILAVSKLQSVEKINELYNQGQRAFAENYVQEALEKISATKNLKIEWHLIGHLQTNKVKSITGLFSYIHSVDSLKLAEALSKYAPADHPQKIFLQVNVAKESTKAGFEVGELSEVAKKISALTGVQICGLMTMPPLQSKPEQNRQYFSELRRLRDSLKSQIPTLIQLSMGTSSDYQVAAQEGANWIRLGTILFGQRPT